MQTKVLNADTSAVKILCARDKRFARLVQMIGAVEYYTHEDGPFSFLVHEIVEQMLSIKAGEKIFSRIAELCGGKVTAKKIVKLSAEDLRATGVSTRKAEAILGLAKSVVSGELNLESLENLSDPEVTKKLMELRGIGSWTAKMYLIFVLDRSDVLPFEDITFLAAYKWLYNTEDVSRTAIEKRCKKWKPYSAVAARFLYAALDSGMCKEKFKLR